MGNVMVGQSSRGISTRVEEDIDHAHQVVAVSATIN